MSAYALNVTAGLRTGVGEPLVPHLDMEPAIRRRLQERWQQEWNRESHNQLRTMQPHTGKYLTEKCPSADCE